MRSLPLPLIALGLGIVCALVSRVLLFIAAIRISGGWAFGAMLPFGPLVFRLNYPAEARNSMLFRYLTLAFFGFYLIKGPGPDLVYRGHRHKIVKDAKQGPKAGDQLYYGTQKSAAAAGTAAPPKPTLSPEQRRAANDQELVRLRTVYDELKLRKRDLLHSNIEGNRDYVVDLAIYNAALARAMIERNALDAMAK